ncbi:iron ABC transporter permease [Actinophytocola xanthii]|uniref:Iron ABC transporter permease n=1 Tax=Actinophytocola xanthii TaxID=1912961 RepID=A0A1Q8CLX6_9PSEU|nr:iron ABC transporter permease [Actinophytocola xanthii]
MPTVTTAVRSGKTALARRSVVVTAVLGVVAFAAFVLSMMVGSVWLGAGEVLGSLFRVTVDRGTDFIVLDLRLPQATSALTVGFALGVSGTLFQQLLRNPLAAPDFVGVSSGASVAAVAGIVVYGAGGLAVPAMAVVGALVSAVLMYVLAFRDGLSGYRFILVGIGVSAFMIGVVGYLLTRADLHDARQAMHWLIGSVGQAGPTELRVLMVVLVALVPVAMLLQRQLRALELGDDLARGLGTRVEWARFALIALPVVLIGLATAVAGPIQFVALVAGPVAARLLRPAPGGVLAAGFTGAAVLLMADMVARHVLPTELPTGVVTGAVGAPYLLWLLATANREGVGG